MRLLATTMFSILIFCFPLLAAEKNCINVFIGPAPLDFGPVIQGNASTQLKLTIRNQRTGTLDLKLERFFFTPVGNLTLSDNEELIREGKQYNLDVKLSGNNPLGNFSGAVDIDDTIRVQGSLIAQRRNLCEIPVIAQIVQALVATPPNLDFGNVSVRTSKSLPISLKPNIVLKNVVLKTSGPFTVQPASFDTIIAGATKQIQVTANATLGSFAGSLTIDFVAQSVNSTTNGTLAVNLKGNGVTQ